MNRRGFLQTCLTLAAAPAIVRVDSLMRVIPLETTVLTEAALEEAILDAGLQNLLWPGIRLWWGRAYSDSEIPNAWNPIVTIRAPSGGLIPGQT